MKSIYIILMTVCFLSTNVLAQKEDKMTNENGLITKVSNSDFETTYESLKKTLENNPNLKIMMEIDHQKNAKSVDIELKPTRVILFGNPKLGSVLMNNSATTAIDLPQKMLVYEDESGKVSVAYNDPMYLKSRHQLSDEVNALLTKISGALNAVSDAAIGQ